MYRVRPSRLVYQLYSLFVAIALFPLSSHLESALYYRLTSYWAHMHPVCFEFCRHRTEKATNQLPNQITLCLIDLMRLCVLKSRYEYDAGLIEGRLLECHIVSHLLL